MQDHPPTEVFDFKTAVREAHELIDAIAKQSPDSSSAARDCPECGRPCKLITGHRSGKIFFQHPLNECIYDNICAHIIFATRAEAMAAEKIFAFKTYDKP